MDSYIKKVKWYFVAICTTTVAVAVVIGLFIIQSPYLKETFIARTWKIMEYKLAFKNDSSLLAQATALIGSEKPLTYTKGNYAEAIPVLVYHGIPNMDDNSTINVPTDVFKDQMFALKKNGYTTITTDELYSFLRGDIALPEKSIAITFDDGRVSSFNSAHPILAAIDFKAIMFAITRYPLNNEGRNNYYLTMNELQQMQKSGIWDIQSHSFDGHGSSYPIGPTESGGHFFSYKQWLVDKNRLETDQEFETRIRNDMQLAKSGLEKNLNKTVSGFAVPYGDFGQNSTNFSGADNIVLNSAADYYNLFFYQNAPGQRFTENYLLDENKGKNFFLIKRMNANVAWSGAELVASLERSAPKPIPFIDSFATDSGWIDTWGTIAVKDNALTIQALPNEGGSTAILDGTRLWKNYIVKATVNSPAKSGVYLWLRFQDDNNNIACNFSNGFIRIEQTVNGVKNIIQGKDDKTIVVPTGDFEVQGSVNGRKITCTLNKKKSVTDTFADTNLANGGIGFKTWSEVRGIAKLIITNLSVTSI